MASVPTRIDQNVINHIALVLDASQSMEGIATATVQVADSTVAGLATRSKEMDQETRATVYTFSNDVTCVFYDKDVLRLPTLQGKYRIQYRTALIDATLKAIDDLEHSATLYGDHGFLVYVVTDGQENQSQRSRVELRNKLDRLPDNWTIAVLVPNEAGAREARELGFPNGNILIWTTTAQGMLDVGARIQASSYNYMTQRAAGVRGTRNLFTVDAAHIKPSVLDSHRGEYRIWRASFDVVIRPFVESMGQPYVTGRAYYELVKRETIQSHKEICIYDQRTNTLYSGERVRAQLGLPYHTIDVSPDEHPAYTIFVQSTSVNRKIPAGSRVLYL